MKNEELKTAEIRKRRRKAATGIYLAILLIFVSGIVVGGIIGAIIKGFSIDNEDCVQIESPLYGTRDGKVITDDGIMIIESSDFTPLDCSLSEELQEYTYYMCEAYYIDFNFVMALMYVESSFRTDVISVTDDYGLMQINACNHKELSDELGITDFTDAYQNIRAGLYILRRLFERYDDEAKVLMAYKMGDYGASVLWDKGVYSTNYTNKILAKADEYAAQGAVSE